MTAGARPAATCSTHLTDTGPHTGGGEAPEQRDSVRAARPEK
ncbi:hypothetical protein [Streptomyces cyaneofuscatus]